MAIVDYDGHCEEHPDGWVASCSNCHSDGYCVECYDEAAKEKEAARWRPVLERLIEAAEEQILWGGGYECEEIKDSLTEARKLLGE